MSEVITQAIIGMPFDMAMNNELSRRQFHSRAQDLLADYAALESKYAELREVAIKLEQANAGIAQLNGEMRAELAKLRAGQEPVAYITGQFAGRCVIEAINRAAVLPTGMALYTAPQPSAVPEEKE